PHLEGIMRNAVEHLGPPGRYNAKRSGASRPTWKEVIDGFFWLRVMKSREGAVTVRRQVNKNENFTYLNANWY
ncbi:885_t:CDS:2, partial [Diversispora eburnea]